MSEGTSADSQSTRALILGLMAIAAILYVSNLWGYALWAPDEPRFGQVAREMLQSGNWLAPHINGKPYTEKPPLFFWAEAFLSLPAGDVSEFTARMPSVISALIVLGLTFSLAARMFSTSVAVWATIILMTCSRFWWQARTAQIDMLLTACMMLSLYSLWRWDMERRTAWLVGVYAGMGLGLLAKGPPALIFPLATLIAFYWRNPSGRKQTRWVLGTVAALALVMLWFIPARLSITAEGGATAHEAVVNNLVRNTIGRALLGVSKAQYPWYYFETVIVDLLPWTLFLPWAVVYTYRQRGANRMMRFLLSWIVPNFVLFSIFIGKRAIYILPLFPAFAILLALGLAAFLSEPREHWLKRFTAAGILVTLLLFVGALIAPHLKIAEGGIRENPYPIYAFGLGALASCVWFVYALIKKRYVTHFHKDLASVSCLLLFLAPWTIFPTVDQYKSAKPFCEPVRILADEGYDFDLYSVGFSREEYIFYAHHFHETLLTEALPADEIGDWDQYQAMLQVKKARKLIADAVQQVSVADPGRITETERDALRQAIDSAIKNADDETLRQVTEFETLVKREIEDLVMKFTVPQPVFFFVQEDDWRWIYALHDKTITYHCVKRDNVGSRRVLLIANDAGEALMQKTGVR
jgi:4-amino-4-deoxy-L-arabinose transferase-like glycosyltransferase